jgi:hypothetical protein
MDCCFISTCMPFPRFKWMESRHMAQTPLMEGGIAKMNIRRGRRPQVPAFSFTFLKHLEQELCLSSHFCSL